LRARWESTLTVLEIAAVDSAHAAVKEAIAAEATQK
jgi:hypothetical protein